MISGNDAGLPRKHRLFFALWPDDGVRDRISRAVEPLIEGKRARRVKSANLHITLAFLGHVRQTALQAIVEAANEVRGVAFDLTLDHLVSWRAAHVACLVVEPIPTPLAKLVESLRFNLLAKNVDADRKDFRAHLTVARDWRSERLDVRVAPMQWPIREFVLVDSRPGPLGSEYRIVHRWSFTETERA